MKELFIIIVCSIVGYITNYIAIKMLFRPHREIRILGVKVPFTPGVIPKEQARIAENIGEAIGEHILTKETITEVLTSKKVENSIKGAIKNKIVDFINSKNSLSYILEKYTSRKENEYNEYLRNVTRKKIISLLKREDVIGKISEIIEVNIKKYFSENKENINIKIENAIIEFLSSDNFKDLLYNITKNKIDNIDNEKTIIDIFDELDEEKINIFVKNHEKEILSYIIKVLKDENIEASTKKTLGNVISSNLGGIVSMFISKETLADRAYESILEYAEDEENREDILNGVAFVINKALNTKIQDIAILLEKNIDIKNFINNILSSNSFKIDAKSVSSYLTNYLYKTQESKVHDLVNGSLNKIISSNEFESYLNSIIKVTLNNILNKPINEFGICISQDNIEKLTNSIVERLFHFAQEKAFEISKLIDIKAIVEEKINQFEISYAEKIILSIVNKELKSITRLGALLGAVIGIITVLVDI